MKNKLLLFPNSSKRERAECDVEQRYRYWRNKNKRNFILICEGNKMLKRLFQSIPSLGHGITRAKEKKHRKLTRNGYPHCPVTTSSSPITSTKLKRAKRIHKKQKIVVHVFAPQKNVGRKLKAKPFAGKEKEKELSNRRPLSSNHKQTSLL